MDHDFEPGEKPKFYTKEEAEQAGYPGVVEDDKAPNFDHEFEWLDSGLGGAGDEKKEPSRGYIERWRLLARYHAAGLTNNQIARKLGYSAMSVSVALKHQFVQDEIEKYRITRDYDIQTRLKEAADDGIQVIHEIINNDQEKSSTRLDAARWAIEKAHGKAKQEVSVESGTLGSFMELLKSMKSSGEAIDVTPKLGSPENSREIEQHDASSSPNQFASWIDDNLSP